jgi:hypothetical protein
MGRTLEKKAQMMEETLTLPSLSLPTTTAEVLVAETSATALE